MKISPPGAPEGNLEKKLKSILNYAAGKVTIKLPKITVIHVVDGDGLLGMVPEVERFDTDLCPQAFGQRRRLEQRQVGIPNSRASERVAWLVSIPNNCTRRICRQCS